MAVAHRVYAEALLGAAGEKGRLAEVREELADFVAAVQSSEELRGLLRNPQIEPHVKRDALEGALGDADELVRNFLVLAVQKHRAGPLDEVAREFEALVAQEQRRLAVDLTTAYDLSDDEAQAIVGQIEQASGRAVEATRRVDPDLIGGFVLQAGSIRLDASVRGRLQQLREELTATT